MPAQDPAQHVAAALKQSLPLGKGQKGDGDLQWDERPRLPGFAHGFASGN